MSITSMGGRLVTVYRRTALVYDQRALDAVSDSVLPDRQPGAGGYLQVTVEGATVYGQFIVTPGAEVLAFTGNKTLLTSAKLTSITSLAKSGWSDGTWEARMVGADGSRIHGREVIASGVKCHLNRGAARWPTTTAGSAEVERTWFGVDYTTAWSPREGDVFVDDYSAEQWEVIGVPSWLGGLRPHHWEIRVERREGKLYV